MARLHTKHVCTITELREPQKVLAKSGGKPVAIMKNSRCVGYLVPEEAIQSGEPRYATMEELTAYIERTRDQVQPVLDYLKDK